MFKINDRPKFTRTITVMVPEGDGHREDTFTATFQKTDYEESELLTKDGMRAFLKRAIVDLGDITDDNDKPMKFSEELVDLVVADDAARLSAMRTYSEAVTQLKAGN